MSTVERAGVNWRQVGMFLGLTFGLSWLLDLALWLTVGYGQGALIALQLQMLLPAFSAIVLGMFVFKDSPLHRLRVDAERPRVFYYWFIVYTAVLAVACGAVLLSQTTPVLTTASLVVQGLSLLSLVVLIVLRVWSGRDAFARAWLAGGRFVHWLLFGLGFALFYGLQAALNAAFRLGELVDPAQLVVQALPPESGPIVPAVFLLIVGVQSVLLGPLIGLMMGFGEEFGWRGYLQTELIKLGKARGILLLGVIWGVWHAPVIAMGHNYPGYPVAGVFLMIAYTVGLGFILGYAVLKSGSVLLAAYLHALNNQVWSFLVITVCRPADPVFSFGPGLYGIATLAVVVLLVLRDPIWRQSEPT